MWDRCLLLMTLWHGMKITGGKPCEQGWRWYVLCENLDLEDARQVIMVCNGNDDFRNEKYAT